MISHFNVVNKYPILFMLWHVAKGLQPDITIGSMNVLCTQLPYGVLLTSYQGLGIAETYDFKSEANHTISKPLAFPKCTIVPFALNNNHRFLST